MIPAVSIDTALATLTDHWSPKVIGRVNDQYVKVAKLLGEFVWHRHDDEDELFQVIHGRLRIQFADGSETLLSPGELCVIPRGVMHNPVADEECFILLIETVTTKHTGDIETPTTRSIAQQLT
jgi:quercetin dioxygenase-like cupin family protein